MRGWVKGQWWGWGAASPTYLGRIKDLLDLQDVGDVPRVLGEGAQGKGVLADKSCGEGKGGEGGVQAVARCESWGALFSPCSSSLSLASGLTPACSYLPCLGGSPSSQVSDSVLAVGLFPRALLIPTNKANLNRCWASELCLLSWRVPMGAQIGPCCSRGSDSCSCSADVMCLR